MEVSKTTTRTDEKQRFNDVEDDVMLPGYRFHPTDEELVGFYLRRKVEKKPLSIELIKQIDIYKYDPWDLPKVSIGDKEWYFFCMRGRKYRNSVRPNRVTGSGFWKATGIDRPIYSLSDSHDCIGLKKSLVYYRGCAGKGTKTDWMMHEFRLPLPNAKDIAQEAEVWTLCRIFKRVSTYKYKPDLKDAKITNQNKTTNSSSKSRSFESYNYEQHVSFNNSSIKESERKFVLNQHMFMGHMTTSRPEAPLMTSFWNPNSDGDDFFRDRNWDELRSVVELANLDPSLCIV